ncbi:MAG: hypothetical protein RBU23_12545 [Candidatus Auribacterota bacterium]|jgi:hypothetical protein|nr:hypothetical protein [Candidatus Auribacterota bacterium]
MKYLVLVATAVVFSCVSVLYASANDSVITIAQMPIESRLQFEKGIHEDEEISDYTSPDYEVPLENLSDSELKDMGFSDEEIKELRSGKVSD